MAIWSVDTEYRNTDSRNGSDFGIQAQWDPSPYQMQESEQQRRPNLQEMTWRLDSGAQKMRFPFMDNGHMWTGTQLKGAAIISAIKANERTFQLHMEMKQPVFDNSIMQSGLHVMDMKPVFKDIQKLRVLLTLELVQRFNTPRHTSDIAATYHQIENVLCVSMCADWASQEEPRHGLSMDSGMPILVSYDDDDDDDDLSIDSWEELDI